MRTRKAIMIIASVIVAVALIVVFFGYVKNRKSEEQPTFAFVALQKLNIPTKDVVESALKEFLPPNSGITDLSINDKAVSFEVDGQLCMFGYLDAPIPWGDLEGPCTTSWLWRDATAEMKNHEAHLIVLLVGNTNKASQIDRCLLLTRIMAAASKAFDAIGVYWGHGSVVLGTKQFQEMAVCASRDKLPLLAWIEFRLQKNSDHSINVLTTGLEYFGCKEIEILNSKRSIDEILNTATGLAEITLKGEIVKDGDTVGPDAETKIKVRHAKSKWDRKGKVLRVEM